MEKEPLKVSCRNCHARLDISDLEPYSTFPCPECGVIIRVPERFDLDLAFLEQLARDLEIKRGHGIAVRL